MSASPQSTGRPQVDKEALRRKYREERDKRLRSDGNAQYVEIKGQLAHYLEDPYTPLTERAPKRDHVTFAFIGGGFSGLVTGARLKEAGIQDVRIIEKGGDFGGTWYWNRYPGAQCDTASMIYLPLLEEVSHRPTEKYAHGPEILEHSLNIARKYGLYEHALFHTQALSIAWDKAARAWRIKTNRGDDFTAQFIGLGTGPLHLPKLPGIPGIDSFKGHSFHTSRWDYGYTGGDPKGALLSKLADKRVAIIGTGATASNSAPVRIGTDADWTDVDAMFDHGCGLRGNTAYCWGGNRRGALGDGTFTERRVPTAVVAPGLAWTEISAGYAYSCGRRTDGGVSCWGSNELAQLGTGDGGAHTTPRRLAVTRSWLLERDATTYDVEERRPLG